MANSISALKKDVLISKDLVTDKFKDKIHLPPEQIASKAIQAKSDSLGGMLGKSISQVQAFNNSSAQDIFASDLQDTITTIAKAAAQAAVVAIIALI